MLKNALLVLTLGAVPLARAGAPLESAVKLYEDKQYSAAAAALAPIAASEPANAEACYYLGLAISHRGDARALDDALVWLGKAATLAPDNSDYVGDYGGTCLQLADKSRSFNLATRGRNALERAVQLNPGNLEARDGLMRFYAQAPWPLGSSSKAAAEAGEIERRNPALGLDAFLRLGAIEEKRGDAAAARAAYAAALKIDSGSHAASDAMARLEKK